MKSLTSLFLAASFLAVSTASHAAIVDLEFPVSADVWHYFNAVNGAGRELAPPFLLPPDFTGGDRRDAVAVFVFRPELPDGFAPTFRVIEARIRYYDITDASWTLGGTNAYGGSEQLELFASGYGPTYDEATWNGTQPFIGGNNTESLPRDPFPRDLATNANVQNTVTGHTPWALGVPIGYTPGGMSAPFPIEFTLDVDDATTQAELVQDLTNEVSSWIVSSTIEADFMGTPGSVPSVITTEGVASNPGSLAPRLFLRVEELIPAAAAQWQLYE